MCHCELFWQWDICQWQQRVETFYSQRNDNANFIEFSPNTISVHSFDHNSVFSFNQRFVFPRQKPITVARLIKKLSADTEEMIAWKIDRTLLYTASAQLQHSQSDAM